MSVFTGNAKRKTQHSFHDQMLRVVGVLGKKRSLPSAINCLRVASSDGESNSESDDESDDEGDDESDRPSAIDARSRWRSWQE